MAVKASQVLLALRMVVQEATAETPETSPHRTVKMGRLEATAAAILRAQVEKVAMAVMAVMAVMRPPVMAVMAVMAVQPFKAAAEGKLVMREVLGVQLAVTVAMVKMAAQELLRAPWAPWAQEVLRRPAMKVR